MNRHLKFILNLSFACLTIGLGTFYAIRKADISLADLSIVDHIPFEIIFLLIVISITIFFVDACRYLLIAKYLRIKKLSFFECLELSIANFFFSWISPFGLLGPTATIFMLVKKNIDLNKATILSFCKSFFGSFLFVSMALFFSFYLPSTLQSNTLLMTPLLGALIFFIIFFVSLILCALLFSDTCKYSFKNRHLNKLFIEFCRMASSLRELLSVGFFKLLIIIILNVTYAFLFVTPLVILLVSMGSTSVVGAISSSILHTALAYVAPTPHGSGIGDLLIKVLFSPFISFKSAVVAVIIYRALTFYLQILVGSTYLLAVVLINKARK